MDGVTGEGGLRASERSLGFGRAALLRCERAAAELRAGRPVLVGDDGRLVLALALDSAHADTYAMLDGLPGLSLYLTPERAAVLGLEVPAEGCRVPLAGVSFEEACRIGYGRNAKASSLLEPADMLHVEAASLARVALLLPALVVADVDANHERVADCPAIRFGDVEAGWAAVGRRFEIVSRAPVPLKGIEKAEFVVFRGGLAQRDQVAIIVGAPDVAGPVPVRVHSSCLTGDLFGSLKCDCGDQLRNALQILEERGGGVLLYLDQEGRGTGIASKMRAYSLQCEGLDTVDADAELGYGQDGRRYEAAVAMLRGLGISHVELLTNNPRKIALLRAAGIEVDARTPVYGDVTDENRNYLRTKAQRSGHMIDVDRLAVRS